MVRINALESKVEAVDDKFEQLQRSIDNLPKKILTWLLIFGSLIAILEFIGPSIRKTIGMTATQHFYQIAPPTVTAADAVTHYTAR
ncbi:MAG: hypothetical protein KGI06_06165 [Candidatus Micrarchaeota archaeon]|nr:hypothetical protein [Candidatus Micrarchaeota archaeon]